MREVRRNFSNVTLEVQERMKQEYSIRLLVPHKVMNWVFGCFFFLSMKGVFYLLLLISFNPFSSVDCLSATLVGRTIFPFSVSNTHNRLKMFGKKQPSDHIFLKKKKKNDLKN